MKSYGTAKAAQKFVDLYANLIIPKCVDAILGGSGLSNSTYGTVKSHILEQLPRWVSLTRFIGAGISAFSLRNFFYRSSSIDGLNSLDVYALLQRNYPGVTIDHFLSSDPEYNSLTKEEMDEIWQESGLNGMNYQSNKFDCDDYAICLKAQASKWFCKKKDKSGKGLACGIMWGTNKKKGGHAYNFYITPEKKLQLIEPQNGKPIELNTWTPYLVML